MGSKGFTLAEIIVSTLILAIGATAIFSVALSYRFTMKRAVYREEMHHYARRLLEELKSYVTADLGVTSAAPTASCDGGPVVQSWQHPCDTPDPACPTVPQGSSSYVWALAACRHDMTEMLPETLTDEPVGAKLAYTVTVDSDGRRRVDVHMDWMDPQ